ncbi:zinc finger protein 341-like [Antedon mediterranea]|uniref:zinc finger protein 341-like n=1 Tax=Antedon mediterranea TaxID=105859 RepID=UPI003AF9F01D
MFAALNFLNIEFCGVNCHVIIFVQSDNNCKKTLKMATQTLFEALSGIDNQTALAVQSLLETSTSVHEPPQADDEDVFQCGKCKKQFTNLPMFMNHKNSNCLANISRSVNSAFTSSINQNNLNRSIQFNTAVSQSPLAQLTAQNVILSEEVLISPFSSVDHLPNNVLQTNNLTSVPFVTQQTQPQRNNVNQQCFTSVAAINTASFATLSQNHVTFSTPGIARPTPTTAPLLNIADNTQNLVQEELLVNQSKVPKTLSYINFVKDYNELARDKSAGSNIKTAKREGKYKCTYCDKTFPKKFDLNQHIRSHTGEKPFQCIVCGRAFAQKSNVKKHMQTHKVWPSGRGNTLPKKPISKITSKDCEEENAGQENEMVQQQQQETVGEQVKECMVTTQQTAESIIVDNSYLCSFCDKSFKSYFKLKTHMNQHKNEQVFKCILKSCGKTFKNLESFLEHTKTHEMEMSYRCHMCCKNFASLYELGVHQYSHSLYPNQGPRVVQKTFRCNKCMSKYSTQAALDHHNATTNHRFDCTHCGKVFPSERNLRRHLPTHTSVGTFRCEMCDKYFKTEHYLKTHQLIHSGYKPFRCEICQAAFNRKDKLKRHMLIHNPVKRFKCPFQSVTGCKSEFNRPDKLKAHVISHSGVKPFRCQICDKKFCRKTNLSDHMRVHTDDYPNRCEKCNKGYNRNHTCSRFKRNKFTSSKTESKNMIERLDEILEVDYLSNADSALNTETDQVGTRRSKRIKIKKKGRQQELAMKAKASQNVPKENKQGKGVSLTASNMIAGIARDLEIIKAHMNENQKDTDDALPTDRCQDDIEQSILLTQFTESICPPSKNCNLEHSATSAFDAVIGSTTDNQDHSIQASSS